MKLVELFLEAYRRSKTTVKTFWSDYLGAEVEVFEARRGFAQGASESPLLWDVFYDMVLVELERRGVGEDIVTDIGWACSGTQGMGAFADDTFLMGSSVEDMQLTLNILVEVLETVLLRLAPQKSEHMALVFGKTGSVRGQLMLRECLVDAGINHRVTLKGTEVPWVEADVGVRHLGVWVDLLGDWGTTVEKVRDKIAEFTTVVRPAKVGPALLMYMINAVLVSRVLYPLAVASVEPETVDKLEGQVIPWVLRKLGIHGTYARALMSTDKSVGGLGWERWRVRVARIKARLADDLLNHPDGQVRAMYAGIRKNQYEESAGDEQG